jgi:hypothetical protein
MSLLANNNKHVKGRSPSVLLSGMLALANVMKPPRPSEARRRLLKAYVKARLSREADVQPRGYLSHVAKQTNFSRATITLSAQGSGPFGPDLAEAIAKFWGFEDDRAMLAAAQEWWEEEKKKKVTIDELIPRMTPRLLRVVEANRGRWWAETFLAALREDIAWSKEQDPPEGWELLLDKLQPDPDRPPPAIDTDEPPTPDASSPRLGASREKEHAPLPGPERRRATKHKKTG